jgi:hypothetical protein
MTDLADRGEEEEGEIHKCFKGTGSRDHIQESCEGRVDGGR